MNKELILAIDQGTSGSKAVLFNLSGKIIARAVTPLKSFYPSPGFVEQSPGEIYQSVVSSVQKVCRILTGQGGTLKSISSCGISNQRETFVVWDNSGKPLHNSIVWQCKRSEEICIKLDKTAAAEEIKERTGLIVDPYFSGTKMIWLNENNHAVQKAVSDGKAFFGTVDTWLLYNLTNGKEYATDYTNASRTLFFNIRTLEWDGFLLKEFGLSSLNLPELKSSADNFGTTDFEGILPLPIPISGMIGDSHAAAFGEKCFSPGTAKATLGTGSSILMNTGTSIPQSKNGMVTTICWSLPGRIDYALEGIIVSCGSTITWLRDQLKLFEKSSETEDMAFSVKDNGGVYFIPAFSGLGAPYWKKKSGAFISGITFGTGNCHIVRAGLESIAFQIADVIKAMEEDSRVILSALQTDGGITSNRFVMQFMANILDTRINCLDIQDASALGAAFMAGLGAGIYGSIEELNKITYNSTVYLPIPDSNVSVYYQEWKETIRKF